jgi:DNA-3-methyladenine glycosylase I
MIRCPWCGSDPLYIAYHDEEWGRPVHDERRHFEFLLLETQQAGLSWRCILGKREAFRSAYAGFDPNKVARFGPARVDRLLADPGIIRNRRKVSAAIQNARAFLAVVEEFGSFDRYIWRFVDGAPIVNAWTSLSRVPVTTPISDALAKDLKSRGFAFVGSTTMYAHMQAIGMVNDHLTDCFRWAELGGKKKKERRT